MAKKVTRKYIRQLIADGRAKNANECTYDELIELHGHMERIAHSEGACGISGALFRDTETGQLYGIPDRGTTLFTLF